MSEADKLFEELGYKKEILSNKKIKYSNNSSCYNIIIFYLYNKTFFSEEIDEDYEMNQGATLNMQELKAINLKCKELGWIEE